MVEYCPFCPLEHRTDWYYWKSWHDSFGDHNVIVCRDLNNREYKYRILAVDSGFHKKLRKDMLGREFITILETAAICVANAQIASGWAKKIAHIDKKHMKYPDHTHLQICMV